VVFFGIWLTLAGPVAAVALVALIAAELAVPIIAEKRERPPGTRTTSPSATVSSPSSSSVRGCSPQPTRSSRHSTTIAPLISISILTLVVTASLWWIYFWPPHHRAIGPFGRSQRYG